MADFHQSGVVTTLHRLNPDAGGRVESELESISAKTPIGLVLPALYSEFETPAMQRIVPELMRAPYIRHIVVVLAKATKSEYEAARKLFQHFPHKVTFIWIDSERIQELFALLEKRKLSAGDDGKGRSCWLAYGYLLAAGECDTIAVHDCDILNYDRSMLARLVYPVANPAFNFEFCKGYYARIGDRMHGRVTRLFMAPLLHALNEMAPGAPFLRFLESFRYPLAGEFAIKTKLARVNRLPGDWGLEVGVLAEVYRNCSPERTCQVDLADNYEHKHQCLSADDPAKGLRRMSGDIAKALLRTLAGEGLVFTQDHCRSLEVRYVRRAEDSIEQYYADAMLNGLEFDRHAEELAVATFRQSLRQAVMEFSEDPLGFPLIPNWNRIVAAIPEFFRALLDAVNADNQKFQRVAA